MVKQNHLHHREKDRFHPPQREHRQHRAESNGHKIRTCPRTRSHNSKDLSDEQHRRILTARFRTFFYKDHQVASRDSRRQTYYLSHNINLNTNKQIEASTDTLKSHASNIHHIMSAMALEFQQSNPQHHAKSSRHLIGTLTPPSQDFHTHQIHLWLTHMRETITHTLHHRDLTTCTSVVPHQSSTKTTTTQIYRHLLACPIKASYT